MGPTCSYSWRQHQLFLPLPTQVPPLSPWPPPPPWPLPLIPPRRRRLQSLRCLHGLRLLHGRCRRFRPGPPILALPQPPGPPPLIPPRRRRVQGRRHRFRPAAVDSSPAAASKATGGVAVRHGRGARRALEERELRKRGWLAQIAVQK